jgi:hypothetical protein
MEKTMTTAERFIEKLEAAQKAKRDREEAESQEASGETIAFLTQELERAYANFGALLAIL